MSFGCSLWQYLFWVPLLRNYLYFVGGEENNIKAMWYSKFDCSESGFMACYALTPECEEKEENE